MAPTALCIHGQAPIPSVEECCGYWAVTLREWGWLWLLVVQSLQGSFSFSARNGDGDVNALHHDSLFQIFTQLVTRVWLEETETKRGWTLKQPG